MSRKSKVESRKSGKGISARTVYRVAFVGAGNMATALVRGFIAAGLYEPGQMCASDVESAKRAVMKRRLGVATTSDNVAMVKNARVIILAVKPQIIDSVLTELQFVVRRDHIFISIAAGVPTRRLEDRLGSRARVVRVMPNTPALLGEGMAVAVRGRFATAADEKLALRLLRAVGKARAVADERLLDAVTGLSGSGPAYVYLFAEALIEGGRAAGLNPVLAEELALQTITGAAAMLQQAGETPQRLREMVTSPGGTTLAGLTELDRRGFREAVSAAVVVATRRSEELGRG
jgi:pyrroline-5-carboxylate reductase